MLPYFEHKVRFLLDQNALLIVMCITLKQKSTGRQVAPLGHIILSLSQPVITLTRYYCMLSGETVNTNIIVFGLIRLELGHIMLSLSQPVSALAHYYCILN
jgi:hypothetical protein